MDLRLRKISPVQLSSTERTTIITIPNEIVQQILLELPDGYLLNCRLVSKDWKSLASSICRRRHVSLNIGLVFEDAGKTHDFYSISQGSNDLPWSACALDILVQSGSEHRPQFCVWTGQQWYLDTKRLMHFINTFGNQVRKLTVDGDKTSTFMRTLTQMPNLEVLVSVIRPRVEETICVLKSTSPLKLNMLRHLSVILRSQAEVRLMEYLISITKLRSISVTLSEPYHHGYPAGYGNLIVKHIRQTVNLISPIPSITLDISNICTAQFFDILKTPELKINGLKFEFPPDDLHDTDAYFRAFEPFLMNNSNFLEKLTIKESRHYGDETRKMQMPILCKLKELKYSKCSYYTQDSFLHPFTANTFPCLNKVTVKLGTDHQVQRISIFGTQFGSVKEFILDNPNANTDPMGMMEWGQIFPNLIKLTMLGVTAPAHSYIYETWPNLEYLSLSVIVRRFETPRGRKRAPADANIITCGYPKNWNKIWEIPVSLASLTRLQTLILNFWGNRYAEHGCLNSSVHLSLLKLHPLHSISFQNINISEDVMQKLNAYHGSVDAVYTKDEDEG